MTSRTVSPRRHAGARPRAWVLRVSVVLAAGGLLAACSERPQDLRSAPKADAAEYLGTGVVAFTAAGWKPGDRESWVQQLRRRGQWQNEYPRLQKPQ